MTEHARTASNDTAGMDIVSRLRASVGFTLADEAADRIESLKSLVAAETPDYHAHLEAAAWALAHYWHGTASQIWDAPPPVQPDADDYGAARAVLRAIQELHDSGSTSEATDR